MSKSSRAVQQFRELTQQGSSQFEQPAPTYEQGSPIPRFASAKSRGFWNFIFWFRQTKAEAIEDTRLFESSASNCRDRAQFQDAKKTESFKLAAKVEQVIIDKRIEQRGLRQMRASNVFRCRDTIAAIAVCSLDYYAQLLTIRANIKDEEMRSKTESEMKLVHDRSITDLRIDALGLTHDDERGHMEDGF